MAEKTIGLFKTELHRNPAAIGANGGPCRGLDDLELATCAWVGWFNDERLHGELDDCTPAEVEAAWAEATTRVAAGAQLDRPGSKVRAPAALTAPISRRRALDTGRSAAPMATSGGCMVECRR